MSAITPEGLQSSLTNASSTDEKVDALIEVVERQSEAIDRLEEENQELKEELSQHRDESARERAEIKQRVTVLEEDEEPDSSDETPTPEPGETTIREPKTALEDVIQLPEHLAEENLSENQQRARFVARDAHEYTRKVPAGRVIKSSELRRVLTAREEETVYTQTVSRVIDFLTELGGEDVRVSETQAGERVVVFSDEVVKRIVAWHNQSNGVVTEGGATG